MADLIRAHNVTVGKSGVGELLPHTRLHDLRHVHATTLLLAGVPQNHSRSEGAPVSEIRIVRDYPYPLVTVWRALTDPALVPLWTSTGQGGRPEGFKTEVGTRFRFIGKPFPGWDGIVRCEVLAVHEPALLSYDWRNKETDEPTVVTNILEGIPGGTRLTWEHTGFRGIEGMFMSGLLGRVRRKMLDEGLPLVLADIGDDGRLRPGSTLRARP